MSTDATERQATSTGEPSDALGGSVWLYSGLGEDSRVRVEAGDYPDLDDEHLLWADVDLDRVGDLDPLWKHLGIVDQVADLGTDPNSARLLDRDGSFQLTVTGVRNEPEFALFALHCLVGANWVVTAHDGGLDLVDEFNEPLNGETKIGVLSGPAFTSVLLDWALAGYHRAIELVQSGIDHLDEELLGASPDDRGLLERLQAMRRRVRQLRQALAPQREALALLSHPETEVLTGDDVVEDYQRLAEQVDRAMEAIDTTREMIVGSFDIFMTRTAQATNEVMKRLTIVSVLLLPAAVIAGIMGMNFKVALFEVAWMFWVTLGLMAALASVTLWVARRKNWI